MEAGTSFTFESSLAVGTDNVTALSSFPLAGRWDWISDNVADRTSAAYGFSTTDGGGVSNGAGGTGSS